MSQLESSHLSTWHWSTTDQIRTGSWRVSRTWALAATCTNPTHSTRPGFALTAARAIQPKGAPPSSAPPLAELKPTVKEQLPAADQSFVVSSLDSVKAQFLDVEEVIQAIVSSLKLLLGSADVIGYYPYPHLLQEGVRDMS